MRAATGWIPRPRKHPTGIIAQRRATQTRLLVVAVIVLNVLVWLASGDWAVRAFALLLTVLVAPLVHILMTKN